MVPQTSVNSYKISVVIDLESAAKLQMLIRGKTIKAKQIGGRTIHKEMVAMTKGKYIGQLVEEAVKGVKLDAEGMKWLYAQKGRIVLEREKQDALVRAGANRKPKSEWKQRGRVAGKDYGDSYKRAKKA